MRSFSFLRIVLATLLLAAPSAHLVPQATGNAPAQTTPPKPRIRPNDAGAPIPTRYDILRGAVRPLPRQQRSALLPSRHPRRSRRQDHLRQEHHPLQDAQGRHAHPARPPRRRSHIDKILLGTTAAQIRARLPAPSLSTFRRPCTPASVYSIDFYYSGNPRRNRPVRRHQLPERSLRHPGSTPPAKAPAPACGGPTRTSGATKSRAWTSASPSPTAWWTSRTASSWARPTWATATRDGIGMCSYPINNYDVSLNIGNYRALRRPAGRPAPRFLRAARGPGQGQEAVRPGQGNARSLPALLWRVSVREGWL